MWWVAHEEHACSYRLISGCDLDHEYLKGLVDILAEDTMEVVQQIWLIRFNAVTWLQEMFRYFDPFLIHMHQYFKIILSSHLITSSWLIAVLLLFKNQKNDMIYWVDTA